MHTCMLTYVHTYIHTYIHAYIHTYIHTYISTCMHTHMHTYICTYTRTYALSPGPGLQKASSIWLPACRRHGLKSSEARLPSRSHRSVDGILRCCRTLWVALLGVVGDCSWRSLLLVLVVLLALLLVLVWLLLLQWMVSSYCYCRCYSYYNCSYNCCYFSDFSFSCSWARNAFLFLCSFFF